MLPFHQGVRFQACSQSARSFPFQPHCPSIPISQPGNTIPYRKHKAASRNTECRRHGRDGTENEGKMPDQRTAVGATVTRQRQRDGADSSGERARARTGSTSLSLTEPKTQNLHGRETGRTVSRGADGDHGGEPVSHAPSLFGHLILGGENSDDFAPADSFYLRPFSSFAGALWVIGAKCWRAVL